MALTLSTPTRSITSTSTPGPSGSSPGSSANIAAHSTRSLEQTQASMSEEPRPQAGPLPQKRGEIGFQEGIHEVTEVYHGNDNISALPARHPADRDRDDSNSSPPPPPPSDGNGRNAPNVDSSPNLSHRPSSPSSSSVSSTNLQKPAKPCKFPFFTSIRQNIRRSKVGGIRVSTLLRLLLQTAFLSGTITAWVILAIKISQQSSSSNSKHVQNPTIDGGGSQDNQEQTSSFGSANIFVHITFALATLAQLLFYERCIYYVRAQRYAYKHPGAILPRHLRLHPSHGLSNSRDGPSNGSSGSNPGGTNYMAFAPWNRPPLPTYAAALAQSGVGTGDVEDNEIAVLPPPAYGNTRGSTLLLASIGRSGSRRGSRSGSGARMESDDDDAGERGAAPRMDGEWELVERRDAERALRLADTLERLENGTPSH